MVSAIKTRTKADIIPPAGVYRYSDMNPTEVKLKGYNGDEIPAYLVRPEEEGVFPAIVFPHGVHGTEEHVKDVARRLALFGYVSIMPALYTRSGFRSIEELDHDMAPAGAALRGRKHAQADGDMQAAVDYLKTLDCVDSERIGVLGFCSGGTVALSFATATKDAKAVVSCYPNNAVQPSDSNPVPVIDRVKDIACPVLLMSGLDDANPSPDDMGKIEAELRRTGKTVEAHAFNEAAHAFFSDSRDSYRPEAAYIAWGYILDWFAKYLKYA